MHAHRKAQCDLSSANIWCNHIHLHCTHWKGIRTRCWEAHTHAHTHRKWIVLSNIGTFRGVLRCTTHIYKHANAHTVGGGGRMQWERVHESSFEIPLAHRGCFVFPARDSRWFCEGRFSSRINEKLHLSHEKSIFTIYLTSCTKGSH